MITCNDKIHIAICDDEEIFQLLLKNKINKFFQNKKIDIYSYSSAVLLLEDFKKIEFDAVFIDIQLPGINGLQLAEKLRDIDENVGILFVTNYTDCVFDCIKYQPFRFIRKERLNEELPEALSSLVNYFDNKNDLFQFISKYEQIVVKINDINYIESNRNSICIHVKDKEYVCNLNIGKIEKMFNNKGFIRTHSGFLVNARFIFSISKESVKLNDNTIIPISRYRVQEVRQKFSQFARR